MTNPHLTLVYFKSAGRAAAIRALFGIAGIAFEEEYVTFPEYRTRSDYPLGGVPILKIRENGQTTTLLQSNAILVYGARLVNDFLPEEPLALARTIEYLGVVEDFYGYVSPSFKAKDEAEKKALREAFAAEQLPRWLNFVEGRLAANNSGYLVGDGLTVADLKLYAVSVWLAKDVLDYVRGSEILQGYPHVQRHMQTLEQHVRLGGVLTRLKADGLF